MGSLTVASESGRNSPEDHSSGLGGISKTIKGRSKYWFEDGNVTLQVGETRFKLHKSLLANASTMFNDMLALGANAVSDEGTDDRPLQLPGPSLEEFTIFCHAIYSGWGDAHKLGTPDLVRLVSVAHFYKAPEIYARAVAKLDKRRISLIDRIVYAQRYAIDDWIAPAFVALVRTLHTLSNDEAVRIGWYLAFRVTVAQKTIAASRFGKVLQLGKAGCCTSCQTNYLRTPLPQISTLLSSQPASSVAEDQDAYFNYLRAEVKIRCPSVGSCGAQDCQAWPTKEHLTKWFEFEKEEETIKQMID
ncbi:hypothetical protein AURDEDRAFT_116662 [Auricularia subglabra TFB-10046 SS5]|uniref:BTB domain-containing protein n=1 Tax=Auricularia subglabra (strain TFB-10046 / SS5) TaxID=717982 RepID=J0WV16_AURST|nr:hypothetical protein AURDEDRAFT_116662 [Auricularia subglabra TFB-10046 SS5]